jgi:hypothetical protein
MWRRQCMCVVCRHSAAAEACDWWVLIDRLQLRFYFYWYDAISRKRIGMQHTLHPLHYNIAQRWWLGIDRDPTHTQANMA